MVKVNVGINDIEKGDVSGEVCSKLHGKGQIEIEIQY